MTCPRVREAQSPGVHFQQVQWADARAVELRRMLVRRRRWCLDYARMKGIVDRQLRSACLDLISVLTCDLKRQRVPAPQTSQKIEEATFHNERQRPGRREWSNGRARSRANRIDVPAGARPGTASQ